MTRTSISYQPFQAFIYNLGIYLLVSLICLIFSAINLTFIFILFYLGLIMLISAITTLRPYMGRYKKIWTLYTDINNNLYVGKYLVNKQAVKYITKDVIHPVYSGYRNARPSRLVYYILVFDEMPDEIKKKNDNLNAIVFCEIKTFGNMFSTKSRTVEMLKKLEVYKDGYEDIP